MVPLGITRAQSAETHFHTAANQFIGGDNAAALASVNAGLQLAPQSERLNRLKAEIEKKQEEQKQQNQEDRQNQQEQQDGEQQDQQGQNQQQENQDGQQGQNQQPPEQQDPGEQGDDAPKQEPGEAPEQQPGEEGQEQEARPRLDPSKLSRAEAERILQALGNEEETLLRRVARPQTRARRVEKDW